MMRAVRLPALALIAALALAAPAGAATVPGAIVDGPNTDIQSFGGLDVAADGTAALVYLKQEGGVDHVFASVFSAGTWSTPGRVDTGKTDPSAKPRVAVAADGKVLITFLNGAAADKPLYSVFKPNTAGAFGAPVPIEGNPAVRGDDLDMNRDGIAYVTFPVGGGGNDVRAARFDGANWTQVGADFPGAGGVLDNDPTKDAGPADGQREARVVVSPGGNAFVTWSEDGANIGENDVWVRRLDGTTRGGIVKASVDTLNGAASAKTSDMPDIDVDGNGIAWVVFREQFTYGGSNKPRDLARAVAPAPSLGDVQVLDGLPEPPPEGAEFPRIDVNPAGQGLVGMPRQLSFETWGSSLEAGTWSSGFRLDSGANTGASAPVAAIGDDGNGAIAWIHSPGGAEPRVVHVRYRAGGTFGAEQVLSRSELGTVDGQTLEAAADSAADVGVGFAQGTAGSKAIVAALLDHPPRPAGTTPTTTTTPTPGAGTTPITPIALVVRFGADLLVSPALLNSGRVSPSGVLSIRVRNGNAFPVAGRAQLDQVSGSRSTSRTSAKVKRVATRAFSVGASKTTTVRLRLRRAILRTLRRRGKARLRLTLTVTDPSAQVRTARKNITVRKARGRRKR
jgi:hypothetical protein